jgi:hypothetical protein
MLDEQLLDGAAEHVDGLAGDGGRFSKIRMDLQKRGQSETQCLHVIKIQGSVSMYLSIQKPCVSDPDQR